MFGQPIFETFLQQMDAVWLVLERPAVQRQFWALILLALVAEVISGQLTRFRRWLFRHVRPDANSRRSTLRRGLRAVEHTYSPIIAILLGQAAIVYFNSVAWQTGLLQQGLVFLWLLLSYRLVVTLLYAWQNEANAQFYHLRVLLPLFILLLIFAVTRLLSGIVDITSVVLFAISESPVTIGALVLSLFVFYGFLVASWIIQKLLRQVILPRLSTDQGLDNTIYTVTGYLVVSLGILATLAFLGINLTSLAIIGAGLSVGIGFGLQELVGNFISGILLLFEQSIRPGDILEVNGKLGTVERLRIRSTTVRTFDNVEFIVPNQSLLTSSVTTYTHSDRKIRLRIGVGASYNEDPQEVRDALLAAAERHGLVLDDPAPLVFFTGFGASSIDFELLVWVEDLTLMLRAASDLRFMIWREFETRDIEIPFPQQDLHVRSGIPWETISTGQAGTGEEPVSLQQRQREQENSGPRLPDARPRRRKTARKSEDSQ